MVGVGYVVASVAADELRPGDRPLQLDQGLFAWDAAFYRDLAEVGYGGVAEEALRFFPLVPLLSRAVSVPLLGSVGLALVIVSSGAALVAGALLHRLVLVETGDDGVARRAAWLLALLPPASVFVLGYAESTLVAATVGAFLALRRQRWWTAAILGAIASLARPVGLAMVLPAVIEAIRGLGTISVRQRMARLPAIAGPIVGAGAYLIWVGRTFGSWRLPLELQGADDLRGRWVDPPSRAFDAFSGLLGGESLGDGLHAPWIAGFAVLVVVALRRLPASYGVYAAAVLVVALSSESLGSFERYGLSAFPLVVALALVTGARVVEWSSLVVSGAGLAAFATLVFLGAFVP